MLIRQATLLTRRSLGVCIQQSKFIIQNPIVPNSGKQGIYSSTYIRSNPGTVFFSTMPAPACNSSSEHPYESISNYNRNTNNSIGPDGDLFHSKIGPSLLGKRASIQRRFDARSNAIGLLTCGGEGLAKHASFDPQYDRARDWIHNHPVGPAVLSPVLINGLVGALVEASLPQSVPMSNNMNHARPLVVGVEICARIEVVSVYPGGKEDCIENATTIASSALETTGEEYPGKTRGYSVGLKTEVIRVCDGVGIAEGTHNIWIPNYLHM